MRGTLTEKARTILEARYTQPGETINGLFKRVSGGDERYEKLMTSFDFMPNSPTLFNAHTGKRGTLSACFKFDVSDTMLDDEDSIVHTREKAAGVAKWGGGVGYYLGNLRAKNAVIGTVHRKACGPVAVLKDYNALSHLLTQGGKRALAQMGILPCWHPDASEFIHVKDEDPKSLASFNISLSWTNDWMEEVDLGRPGTALNLWNEAIDSAWKTGDPGVYYFDIAEKSNPTPWLGKLTGTNPCGEVPLLNNEPCNLGSINLGNFVTKNREIDFGRLYDVARLATRFLDQILDWNHFPHHLVEKAALLTRKLGLGVMGFADMLVLLHVHYDTHEAVAIGERVMKCINEAAYEESILLAKEKGPYPGYNADLATTPPIRNATRTCIAPTGTIYLICSADGSGIEPHFLIESERKTYEGIIIKEKVAVVEESGGFVPKTTNEIGWQWHVDHQAAFQRHVDLAVSKTINMPNDATRDDIAAAYLHMWKTGCKGGTIYRDGCRVDQVLVKPGEHKEGLGWDTKSGKTTMAVDGHPNISVFNLNPTAVAEGIGLMTEDDIGQLVSKLPGDTVITFVQKAIDQWKGPLPVEISSNRVRRKLPDERDSKIKKINIGGFECYLHVGLFEDGTPGEIFFTVDKHGSTLIGLMDAWAKATSLALQYGTPLEQLVRLNVGTRFEPAGMTKDKDIPVCTSIADYVFRWLSMKFIGVKPTVAVPRSTDITGAHGLLLQAQATVATATEKKVKSGLFCPDCNAEAIYQSGCYECGRACGWSRCG